MKSAAAQPASQAAQAGKTPTSEQAFVLDWSRTLNARDYEKLSQIYGNQVHFYGKQISRTAVVDAKQKVLMASATYRQSIDGVLIEPGPHGFTARFDKTWDGGVRSVHARLVVESADGHHTIVLESDESTDAALRVPVTEGCVQAAFSAARTHPAIRSDRERVAREMPEASLSSLIHENTATLIDGAVGYDLPHRFDTRWWLKVEGGALELHNAYTMEALSFSPEVQARVKKACE